MAPQSGQVLSSDMATEVAQEFYGKTLPSAANDRPNLAFFYRLGNQAYQDVCTRFGWNWVFRIAEFDTVPNQTDPYALDPLAFEVLWVTIPALQIKLRKMQYRDWIVLYPGQYQNVGATQPNWYSVAPTDPAVNNGPRLSLGPGAADQVYTIRYGFLKTPAVLTFTGTEYPIIPVQWQELWKYQWLMKLYRFAGPGSVDKLRMVEEAYEKLFRDAWMADQNEPDTVQRFRDIWSENAYGSALDLNRVLFYGGY